MKEAGRICFRSEKWIIIRCIIICSFHESSNVSTIERHSDFHPLKTEFGDLVFAVVSMVRM